MDIGKSRRSNKDESGSVFGLSETCQGEEFGVDYDEEAFAAGQGHALRVLNFGFVKELAAIAPDVAAGESQGLVEGDRTEVVNLYMAGHGEDIKRAVELAHGLVKEGGYNASVNVAGRAFVVTVELKAGGGGGMIRVRCVGGENEVQALRVGRTAAEAVAGSFVDGGITVHRDRGVTG